MKNITLPLGGIAILDKIDKDYGFFSDIFRNFCGKSKDFLSLVKLHINNKLTQSVSVHQILNSSPEELAEQLGMEKMPSERTLYRTLERIGRHYPVLHYRFQKFLKKHNLVSGTQFTDFSSFYVEGKHSALSAYGYSRDRRPDKQQINFGIATGITGIPSALTIQKGNVTDKKHLNQMLKLVAKILPKKSLLIFDAGANTKKNKERITSLGYNYLTLKPKKLGAYQRYLLLFSEGLRQGNIKTFGVNGGQYSCLKKNEGEAVFYIFFSHELYRTQLQIKHRKFERQKEKGNKTLKKRKHIRLPSDKGWVEFIPALQRTLEDLKNPYITGIEGFFILESSVNAEPEKILRLYKEKDKAEKLIRNLKEGLELRPIRHWNKWTVIGMIFVCFLTQFLINLTLFLSKKPLVKNVKLLKKFLINLTVTVVYPDKGFRFNLISNVSPQINSILGDFWKKYQTKNLDLRW